MGSSDRDNLTFNLVFNGSVIWHHDQFVTWLPFVRRLIDAYPAFSYSQLSDRFDAIDDEADHDVMARLRLFLVCSNGEIIWQDTGDWSAAKADSLDSVLITLTELADDFY